MSITSESRANALLTVPRKLLDEYLAQAAEQLTRRRMVVGEQIRKAREAKHWKQKELATRVHVEPQTISNWERGARVPDWDKLEVLARELADELGMNVRQVKRWEAGQLPSEESAYALAALAPRRLKAKPELFFEPRARREERFAALERRVEALERRLARGGL